MNVQTHTGQFSGNVSNRYSLNNINVLYRVLVSLSFNSQLNEYLQKYYRDNALKLNTKLTG